MAAFAQLSNLLEVDQLDVEDECAGLHGQHSMSAILNPLSLDAL